MYRLLPSAISSKCLHVGNNFIKSFWYSSCKKSIWFCPERFAKMNTKNWNVRTHFWMLVSVSSTCGRSVDCFVVDKI